MTSIGYSVSVPNLLSLRRRGATLSGMGHLRNLTVLALLSACATDATGSEGADPDSGTQQRQTAAGVVWECSATEPVLDLPFSVECDVGEREVSCKATVANPDRLYCVEDARPGQWFIYEGGTKGEKTGDFGMVFTTYRGGTETVHDCDEMRSTLLPQGWCER